MRFIVRSACVILKFRYDSWVQLNYFYLTGDCCNDALCEEGIFLAYAIS